MSREFYDRAVDWARVSVEKAASEERGHMRKILGTMVKHHDKVLDQRGSSGNRDGGGGPLGMWRTNPVPFDEKLGKKKKYKKKKTGIDDNFVPELNKRQSQAQTWEHFNRLCAGEKLMSEEKEKLLKCQHLHHNDNYLRLGPFKLDIQHDAPFVGVFRNILYDDEMEHYKDFARDKLYRSEVQTKQKTVVTRTSKQAWLQDTLINRTLPGQPYTGHRQDLIIMDEVAAKISDRITLATRLHTLLASGSEPYQVRRSQQFKNHTSHRIDQYLRSLIMALVVYTTHILTL